MAAERRCYVVSPLALPTFARLLELAGSDLPYVSRDDFLAWLDGSPVPRDDFLAWFDDLSVPRDGSTTPADHSPVPPKRSPVRGKHFPAPIDHFPAPTGHWTARRKLVLVPLERSAKCEDGVTAPEYVSATLENHLGAPLFPPEHAVNPSTQKEIITYA